MWSIVIVLIFLLLGIIISRLQLQRKNRELWVANEKLELSEVKYRQQVGSTLDFYFMSDKEGKVVFISQAV